MRRVSTSRAALSGLGVGFAMQLRDTQQGASIFSDPFSKLTSQPSTDPVDNTFSLSTLLDMHCDL